MPEYLAPGVFVEEVSFRSKSIEGVATSTTGFVGLANYGPVRYSGGPSTCEPRLITSFTEFERVYGGMQDIEVSVGERTNYLAHAVRAFFENGGRRVYISRVFSSNSSDDNFSGVAESLISSLDSTAAWRARWPGKAGNVFVETKVMRSKNLSYSDNGVIQAKSVKDGAVVELVTDGATTPSRLPKDDADLSNSTLLVVSVDENGIQKFIEDDAGTNATLTDKDAILLLEMTVRVKVDNERTDEYVGLAASKKQKRYIGKILEKDNPEDENAVVWLDLMENNPDGDFFPARLFSALCGNSGRLGDGDDGGLPIANDYMGEEADPENVTQKATGLAALGEIDDIAIVAVPDSGDMGNENVSFEIADKLVTHATKLKYRIAIVDGPKNSSINKIRTFRGRFDSSYAAIYYPWIRIFDPTERFSQGAPPKQIDLPPSGFIAGIYARNDNNRGVHKAPANEVVRGLTRFEVNINQGRNEVINPEGINALRFFEGRGYRVWGARTMSSDPEWKYVNVRRLFIYIEHSMEKGTQWAVFEPNNSRLWKNIRRTVEDFLLVLWRDGALMGATPEDAFFVRCDRTTMTQNDLDNGRLICLVGVAPVKPAEFVIFRIGQWTADAS